MFKKFPFLCAVPIFLFIQSPSHQALAQSIDYGSLEELFGEPITTSATGQPQRTSEVPVTMEIITAEDIRRSGAVNIPDILRAHSSISVWNWTSATTDVNVRGYNQAFSPRLLVLINGRQIYSDSYGNTFWQNVPVQLEEIRQIEIVEGPNSALFGFNAVSGVINIITYNPLYDDVSSATLRAGTNGYQQGTIVHTQKFGDKVSVRISGNNTRLNEYNAPSGSTSFYDPAHHEYSLDSVVQVTDNSQLRIETNKTKSKSSGYSYGYTKFNNKYNNHSFKTSYTANTDLGIIQANLYQNSEDVKSVGTVASHYKNKVNVVQFEDLFKIGVNHTLRLQTEYRHNALHGTLIADQAEIFYDVYSAGGMWSWKIRDDLTWTNATRIDYMDIGRTGNLTSNAVLTSNDQFDVQLTELSYNSGVVWNASKLDTIRIMTARGIQAPPLLDLGIELTVSPFLVLGNPKLNASVVTNYEVAYEHKIDDINGTFSGNIFYQETKNLKGGSTLTGSVTQPTNIGSTSMIGIELGLDGRIGEHWDWDTSYTLEKVADDFQSGFSAPNLLYNGEQATPAHSLSAHVGYTDGPWEADAYAQYVSKYEVLLGNGTSYDPIKMGNSLNLSARVGYNIRENMTLALSGQELNHSKARETSGPAKDRQVFLTLSTSF